MDGAFSPLAGRPAPAFSIALARERLARRAAEEGERRWAFLAEASALLAQTTHYTEAFEALARIAVPYLCDYCLVDEVQPDGGVHRIAVAHRDPAKERLLYRSVHQMAAEGADPDRHPVLHVLQTGVARLVAEVSPGALERLAHDEGHRARLRALQLHSFIVVPLVARGRALGAITLASAESRRVFGESDMALAEEVARRSALVIDNARLLDRARRAVRAREHLLATVSHELRNPLGAILLEATGTLDTEDALAPSVRGSLERVVGAVEQANRLIEDLLDISQVESGRLAVQRGPAGLTSLLREAADRFRPAAVAAGLALETDLPEDPLPVEADGARIQQLLANLLGNAAKFTPPGGRVWLRARREGEEARVEVEDTGCGIPADDLPHVFDAYWQGAHGRRGTGLGLAVARAVAEAHGGTLAVDPAAGPGARLVFRIPLAA